MSVPQEDIINSIGKSKSDVARVQVKTGPRQTPTSSVVSVATGNIVCRKKGDQAPQFVGEFTYDDINGFRLDGYSPVAWLTIVKPRLANG